ncbi:hypothetical protein AS361_01530 [Myroides marinus]|uniref:hypothetical protein n=1 Tax=Myroides marinus TaxID=703342 RepID=UPI00074247DF|nr:hypothetical protein [Myroides marinus]KUF41723.1 hypothetical protein AS361_01530 [Myroides marinus]
MTIEELFLSNKISARSCNACIDNNLNTIDDLVGYYLENGTFDKLRKCGRRTNEELILVCKSYASSTTLKIVTKTDEREYLEKILADLNKLKRDIVNNYISFSFRKMKARGQNALLLFLDKNLKLRNISELILLNPNFNVSSLKNVGGASVEQIKFFIKDLISFIEHIITIDDESELINLKNSLYLKNVFSDSSIPNELEQMNDIFVLVDYLINSYVLFNKNENYILNKGIKTFESSELLSIEQIANDLGFTKERVRQIRVDIIGRLPNRLSFLSDLETDLVSKYNILKESTFIEVSKESIEKINQSRDYKFTTEFIIFILSIVFAQDYSLVGNLQDVMLYKVNMARERHNWKGHYLVKKELVEKFDFTAFVNDLSARYEQRINKKYTINLKGYLCEFIEQIDLELLEELFPIAKKLIQSEFDQLLDIDDNLIFNRNTLMSGYEYVYNALETLGKESTVEEIYLKIKELYPSYDTDVDKVRSYLKREYGFAPIGRQSVFILQAWEDKNAGVRGGTIKDIVYDYLKDKDHTVHIFELLDEIHRYRDTTNANNVLTNLNLDPQKLFIVFTKGFVGLTSKTYNENECKLKRSVGKDIIKYVKNNQGVSFSKAVEYLSNKLNIKVVSAKHIIREIVSNGDLTINELNELTK